MGKWEVHVKVPLRTIKLMKKISLILILLSSSSFVYADSEQQTLNKDSIEMVCKTTLTFAEIVMKGKQDDVPLSKMLSVKDKLVENFGEKADLTAMIFQWVIDDAYRLPRFDNDHQNQIQLRNFAEQEYFACKDALTKEVMKNE